MESQKQAKCWNKTSVVQISFLSVLSWASALNSTWIYSVCTQYTFTSSNSGDNIRNYNNLLSNLITIGQITVEICLISCFRLHYQFSHSRRSVVNDMSVNDRTALMSKLFTPYYVTFISPFCCDSWASQLSQTMHAWPLDLEFNRDDILNISVSSYSHRISFVDEFYESFHTY